MWAAEGVVCGTDSPQRSSASGLGLLWEPRAASAHPRPLPACLLVLRFLSCPSKTAGQAVAKLLPPGT